MIHSVFPVIFRDVPRRRRVASIALLLCFCALEVCFAARRVSDDRQKLITYALSYEGTRYVLGGQTPEEGFDCSGYVDYVVNEALGVVLPRTANAIYQSASVEKIEPREREPGDLMFFKNDMNSDKVTHVGIYCGVYHGKRTEFEGKRVFISCVSDGAKTGVLLELIDARFWRNHFFAYGRILPATGE